MAKIKSAFDYLQHKTKESWNIGKNSLFCSFTTSRLVTLCCRILLGNQTNKNYHAECRKLLFSLFCFFVSWLLKCILSDSKITIVYVHKNEQHKVVLKLTTSYWIKRQKSELWAANLAVECLVESESRGWQVCGISAVGSASVS